MTSARRLYRLNLAAAALGALAVITVLGVALSKMSLAPLSVEELRATCGSFLPTELSPLAAALVGLAGFVLIVLGRGIRSAWSRPGRSFGCARACVRSSSTNSRARLSGSFRAAARRPSAGLLRPRVFASAAACNRLSQAELRAVLAHEGRSVPSLRFSSKR